MAKSDKLCPGCFSEKGDTQECPHCNYDEDQLRSPLALPHRTLLYRQFLVGRVLGKPGGFGITYFGWDTTLETSVAIKEYLPRDLVGRDTISSTIVPHSEEDRRIFRHGLDQFMQEARNLAKFQHPNLVRVRHFFEENDTAYLVMDYYEGLNLDEHIRRQGGKLPEHKAVTIIRQILEGLAVVHEQGLLHRDIKPQNIYLTNEGQAILLDFGAARISTGNMTRSLSVILTPGFAPFEQYHGRSLQGPWTDIYACAATLFYLVTGEIPPEATERVRPKEFLEPKLEATALSRGLHDALQKGLSPEPGDRPQGVREFSDLLLQGQRAAWPQDLETKTIGRTMPLRQKAAKRPHLRRNWRWWLAASSSPFLVLIVLLWLKSLQQVPSPQGSSPDTSSALAKNPPSISERAKLYAQYRTAGDTYFRQSKYNDALAQYELALGEKPGDAYATAKISESREKIFESEVAKVEKNRLYQKYREEGDAFFTQGNFVGAKKKYESALSQRPADFYAADQIKHCDSKIAEEKVADRQKLYVSLRNEGDTLFNRGEYTEAQNKYRSAMEYRSDTTIRKKLNTARARLDEIKRDFVLVEGGTFHMGSVNGDANEQPVHRVTVGSFYISKYEVTNAQYCEFLNERGNQSEGGRQWLDLKVSGKIEEIDERLVPKPGYENHPVYGVSWYGAKAFCEWRGGRLPTEAEWEYAARGGKKSRGYRFSGSDDPDVVGWHGRDYGWLIFSEDKKEKRYQPLPVGQKQPNELGIYDMSGNVWEWCADWYDQNYYRNSPQQNPKGPTTGKEPYRVLRGGWWGSHQSEIRSTYRSGAFYGIEGGQYGGFRCVRDAL